MRRGRGPESAHQRPRGIGQGQGLPAGEPRTGTLPGPANRQRGLGPTAGAPRKRGMITPRPANRPTGGVEEDNAGMPVKQAFTKKKTHRGERQPRLKPHQEDANQHRTSGRRHEDHRDREPEEGGPQRWEPGRGLALILLPYPPARRAYSCPGKRCRRQKKADYDAWKSFII